MGQFGGLKLDALYGGRTRRDRTHSSHSHGKSVRQVRVEQLTLAVPVTAAIIPPSITPIPQPYVSTSRILQLRSAYGPGRRRPGTRLHLSLPGLPAKDGQRLRPAGQVPPRERIASGHVNRVRAGGR